MVASRMGSGRCQLVVLSSSCHARIRHRIHTLLLLILLSPSLSLLCTLSMFSLTLSLSDTHKRTITPLCTQCLFNTYFHSSSLSHTHPHLLLPMFYLPFSHTLYESSLYSLARDLAWDANLIQVIVEKLI